MSPPKVQAGWTTVRNVHVQEQRDCANCGAVLAGDARFCQRCGAPVALMFADDGEPVQAAEPPSPLRIWGPRVAAGLLIVVACLAAMFALLALLFGVFVE
jgi:predicted amidophosphoribosyltransferase